MDSSIGWTELEPVSCTLSECLLGQGNRGTVIRARRTQNSHFQRGDWTGRTSGVGLLDDVAVKVLVLTPDTAEEVLQRTLAEANLARFLETRAIGTHCVTSILSVVSGPMSESWMRLFPMVYFTLHRWSNSNDCVERFQLRDRHAY